MNKQLNLIINGKSGVGKSFFATNFVQYLNRSGHLRRVIDSDHENSMPKRFTRKQISKPGTPPGRPGTP